MQSSLCGGLPWIGSLHGGISRFMELRGLEFCGYGILVDENEMLLDPMIYRWWIMHGTILVHGSIMGVQHMVPFDLWWV
jgi:hypothetical protein